MALRKYTRNGKAGLVTPNAYNAFVEVANAYQQGKIGGGGLDLSPRTPIVRVQNGTASPVERWGILAINGPIIDPDVNAAGFQKQVAFAGAAVTTDTVNRFVICQTPLAVDAIGPCVASGVSICLVDSEVETGDYVKAEADNTTYLVKADGGSCCEVLYTIPGDYETYGGKFAIVRLGIKAEAAGGIKWAGLNATLVPGGNASADIGSDTVTIYDLYWRNFGITGENILVQYSTENSRWETVGSHGLIRTGKADSSISPGAGGTVSIWTGNTISDSGVNVTANYDWADAGGGTISSGDEVFVTWIPDQERWRVTAKPCS